MSQGRPVSNETRLGNSNIQSNISQSIFGRRNCRRQTYLPINGGLLQNSKDPDTKLKGELYLGSNRSQCIRVEYWGRGILRHSTVGTPAN